MSKKQLEAVNDFRNELHKRVEFLSDALSIIIPITKEDEEMIKVGIDMLTSFDNELQSAQSLRELSEYVDVDKITEQWEDTKELINRRARSMTDEIDAMRGLLQRSE